MTLDEFMDQAHPNTLKWMELDLMEKLLKVDNLYKMQDTVNIIKEVPND